MKRPWIPTLYEPCPCGQHVLRVRDHVWLEKTDHGPRVIFSPPACVRAIAPDVAPPPTLEAAQ